MVVLRLEPRQASSTHSRALLCFPFRHKAAGVWRNPVPPLNLGYRAAVRAASWQEAGVICGSKHPYILSQAKQCSQAVLRWWEAAWLPAISQREPWVIPSQAKLRKVERPQCPGLTFHWHWLPFRFKYPRWNDQRIQFWLLKTFQSHEVT